MNSGKPSANILDHLSTEEAAAVLDLLLDKHPELRPEIEKMAKDEMSSVSMDDIAEDVFSAVTRIDLDMLNGRAGKHSWGYVEPSEAAWELLEEAVEDWVEDMNRRLESDSVSAAAAVCAGIVSGLYKARNAKGDVLEWASDFPGDHAGYIVEEFLRSCRYKMNKDERAEFLKKLADHAPEWKDMFSRVAERSA